MGNFLALYFDGVIRWHGTYRGKIVRWRRQTLYRETWESWQTNGQAENNSGHEA
jgi:hypothetical protein